MQPIPLRTTVVGSYPRPGWLEVAASNLEPFGPADHAELLEDAVLAAVHDQLACGLDVITDGELTRLEGNRSFYALISGVDIEALPARRLGPPGHDQRGRHAVNGVLEAPRGLGAAEEFERLRRIASPHLAPLGNRAPILKVSIPGPYTLSERLTPNTLYRDRWALAEALLPLVSRELERLVEAGCREISLDESAMSCDSHQQDVRRFVDIFNRTAAPVAQSCRLSAHLSFGNYKSRALGPRSYGAMLPAMLELQAHEIHLEMASREFADIELIQDIAQKRDVSVGLVDAKSDYIESAPDVAARVRKCLELAPPERLSFAPDCGLDYTPRWAARQKLRNLCDGVKQVRAELGL